MPKTRQEKRKTGMNIIQETIMKHEANSGKQQMISLRDRVAIECKYKKVKIVEELYKKKYYFSKVTVLPVNTRSNNSQYSLYPQDIKRVKASGEDIYCRTL